ncbi:MAG: kynureninase [Chitinophagales bacterium]|nr:kynureninase [Bacteroidota bacterium]MBK9556094.1 kynureninase [Bacteroidota bacterium]MBL0279134.1 kynureninase [Bacteroidota bacterium]MBP9879687.1 kynureninase [Chitinophagales bacterium]
MSTTYQATAAFAANLDATDELKDYRNRFHIPSANGKSLIYFCGNSLGLQPKSTRAYLEQELTDWQNLGVEGHLHAKNPWLYYHHFLTDATARLVGAKPIEVVVMNSLTVNLNLLMISFYRPTAKRNKIMMEYMAFPSDQYAVENQVKFHGYNPNEAIIELMPREGENCIRTADILAKIDEHKDELALIMIGGVNYYTGQLFDMATITSHAKNCSSDIVVGYDLAHATGNVKMDLHDWNVDFATWCSYKYLNSGPGGTSGVFVHEKHAENNLLPRLSGWWGNDESTRFKMQKGFIPQQGAAGWQMSNAQVLSMAAHRASLAIFDEVGMDKLIAKSKLLTGYLEFLLLNGKRKDFKIITPEDVAQRGCQLSIVMNENGKKTFDALTQNGVIADWREPDVIRVAPVPLYNTFEDVYRFAEIFHAV